MPTFETFTRDLPSRTGTPRVTVLRSGMLSLNKPAFLALDAPEAVELLFDGDEQVIGVRPVGASADSAYIVRHPARGDSGPFLITALAFTKFYDIDTTQSFRWDASLLDGVLCVRLTDPPTAVTSNRARTRTASKPASTVVPIRSSAPHSDQSDRTRFG